MLFLSLPLQKEQPSTGHIISEKQNLIQQQYRQMDRGQHYIYKIPRSGFSATTLKSTTP